MAVHEGRSQSRAAVRHSGLKFTQADHRIGAVKLGKVEAGEIVYQLGDISSRRAYLDRGADRVAIVLNQENDRQLAVGGSVERLPELALRGCPFAQGCQNHFIAVENHVAVGAIVSLVFLGDLRMMVKVAAGLRATHGMKQLRGSG